MKDHTVYHNEDNIDISDSIAMQNLGNLASGRHEGVYDLTSLRCMQNCTAASNVTAASEFGVIPSYNEPSSKSRSRELHESNPFLAPRKTEQVLLTSKHAPYNVPAFNTLDFPHWVCPAEHMQADPKGRGGWLGALHPDGSLYFHKSCQTEHGSFTILTEAYLHGEDMLYEVTAFARYMWQHIPLSRDRYVGEDLEVVINVKTDAEKNNVTWSYYLIDHFRRMPFWMRDYNPSVHMRTTARLGASSPDHLRHLLTAMYWEHCALYPCHNGGKRIPPNNIHAKLVTGLAWCAAESVVAPIRYTAPYTAEEAIRLRDQLDYLRKNAEECPEPYIEVAGRTMSSLERWRYNFLHGTQVIRRFRGQTVLPQRRLSFPYRALIPLLFYAPLPHLYDCKSVYLDGILADEPEWTRYVRKLLTEWQEFVLYATILLNANLAFLTVPNALTVDPDGSTNSSQHQAVSPAAILSYCSMLASFGSITIGLLLIRQHRGEGLEDNPRTKKSTFLVKRKSKHFGFELLSVLYSLPYVCLMWSIILFLCAFITFSQLNSDWPSRAPTLAGLIMVMSLSLWCIQMGWGSSLGRDFFRFNTAGKLPAVPTRRVLVRIMTSLAVVQDISTRCANAVRLDALNICFWRTTERRKSGEQAA